MAFFDGGRPRLFGHRGAAAVAAENTMSSFSRAIHDGAEYLEFDVHASLDGQVVVIHDPTVDRTTNGTGAVKELTLAALRRLDAGYRLDVDDGSVPARDLRAEVPTLAAVLRAFPAVPMTIEVKQVDPPIVDQVTAAVMSCGAADRVLLASASDETMQAIRAACAGQRVVTGFSFGEVAEFLTRVAEGRLEDYHAPGNALQVPPAWHDIPVITAAMVDAAHGCGVEVHAWTVNDEEEMDALLDLGVDGIITDDPALGRRVIDRRAAPARL